MNDARTVSGKGSMFTTQQLPWTKAHYILLALIILFTGAAQIYLFKQAFYSISPDESGRVLNAAEMSFRQILKPTWFPPLYAFINKLGLSLYYDLFLTPRVMASLAGILTSLALMFFAHRLFGNSRISIMTGILAVYFPHRLIFSVAPMSEIYFMCFMTLGCAFVLGWFSDAKKWDLLCSSICFLLCSSLRYEGWLVCATMASILSVQRFIHGKPGWRSYLVNIAILASFPLYWFLSAYFSKRMWAFSCIAQYYIDVHGKDLTKVWQRSFLYQFIEQAVFSPLIVGLLSIVYHAFQDRKVRLLSLLLLVPILGMTAMGFVSYALPAHNWWRVAGPALFLLLPFLAPLIYKVTLLLFANRHLQYTFLLITSVLCMAAFHNEVTERTKKSCMKSDHLKLGAVIKTLSLEGNEKILIDTSTWIYTNVIVASNIPDRFIGNGGPGPLNPKPAVLDFKDGIDVKLLKKWNIKYLVFQTKKGPAEYGRKFLFEMKSRTTILNTSKALRKLNQIGECGIYAVQ